MAHKIQLTILLLITICITKLNAGVDEEIAYQAEIQTTFLENGRSSFCHATILSQRYAITAASCFTEISPSFFLTESDYDYKLMWNNDEYLIDTLQRHEKYVTSTKANNLALIKVNRDFPITGNDVINGIRNFDINRLDSNDVLEMIGFMANKTPLGKQLGCSISGELLSSAECTRKVTSVDRSKLMYLNSPNICFVPDSIRGCDFSKGAALIGESIIIGVLSEYPVTCLRGTNCLPFIFTPLTNYSDWLERQINI